MRDQFASVPCKPHFPIAIVVYPIFLQGISYRIIVFKSFIELIISFTSECP